MNDEIVEEARDLLATRSQRGLEKYGTPLTRTDLSLDDWLQHAIEEQADNLLYLIRARHDTTALEARAEAAERKAALADEAAKIARTGIPPGIWPEGWLTRYDALSTPTGARNEGNDE